MPIDPLSDAKIVESWHANAEPWTSAVRSQAIESRRLVTDQAIVDAVLARAPNVVLDVGCGEGWLVRALHAAGVRAIGVDAVPALVERAGQLGDGEFHVASYEAIAAGALGASGALGIGPLDVAVANFALIGHEAVDDLVRAMPTLLRAGGAFIVQTLHPVVATGDQPYHDGWRTGSWAGFGAEFTDPAPWYFRTIESWVRLFVESGLVVREIREPVHPHTGRPASVIFVAENQSTVIPA